MKNINLTITKLFCLAVFTAMFSLQSFAKQGQIRLTNKVFKQVITTDKSGNKKIDYVAPELAIPGDVMFYVTTFENISQETVDDIVIRNSIPNNSKFRTGSVEGKDMKVDYSVDKGKSFGQPEKLFVTDRAGKKWTARPEDYTDIRWIYKKSLPAGEKGTVTFKTMIKK
jgi:uncharacterized repeat protein (TIGR01451 family)